MAEFHTVSGRHLRMLRFRHRFLFQYTVGAAYPFVDVARVASQKRQLIDWRSHARSHDDEK
jgi:hypothetical protein